MTKTNKYYLFQNKVLLPIMVAVVGLVIVAIIYFLKNRDPENVVRDVLFSAADETAVSSNGFRSDFIAGYFKSDPVASSFGQLPQFILVSNKVGFLEADVSLFEKSAGVNGSANIEVAKITLVKRLGEFWGKWRIRSVIPLDLVLSQPISNILSKSNNEVLGSQNPLQIGDLTVKFGDFKATHLPQNDTDFVSLSQAVEITNLDKFAADDSWSYALKNDSGAYCGDHGESALAKGSNSLAELNFKISKNDFKNCQPTAIEINSQKYGKFVVAAKATNASEI